MKNIEHNHAIKEVFQAHFLSEEVEKYLIQALCFSIKKSFKMKKENYKL